MRSSHLGKTILFKVSRKRETCQIQEPQEFNFLRSSGKAEHPGTTSIYGDFLRMQRKPRHPGKQEITNFRGIQRKRNILEKRRISSHFELRHS